MSKRKKYKKRKYVKTSKLEKKFAKMLREWGIYYKRQFKLKNKYYDFYLPKYNLLIEADGDYWHGNKKKFKNLNKIQIESKVNDLYKDGLAKLKGFHIIRFWEHEIHNSPGNVKRKLYKKIKKIEDE